jgi:hypothetical protein
VGAAVVGVPGRVVALLATVVVRADAVVVVLTPSDGSGFAGWATGVGPPGRVVEPEVEPRAGTHALTSTVAQNTTAPR